MHKQKIIRREASFQHYDADQVLQTFENQKPANAADLAALTTDILDDLVKKFVTVTHQTGVSAGI